MPTRATNEKRGSIEQMDPDLPIIVSGPDNWFGPIGNDATFTVVATSGDGSPLTYQWQINEGSGWSDITDGGRYSGATTDTLTVSPTELGDQGDQFRCQVCNDSGCVFSGSANLTMSLIQPIVDAGGPYSSQVDVPGAILGTVTPGSAPITGTVWSSNGPGAFDDPTALSTNYTPSATGVQTLTLTATPSVGNPVSDTAQYTSTAVPVTPPTVEAGGPYTGTVNTSIALDATVTPGTDPSPDLLWTIVSGGGGLFSDATIEDPTFTPTSEGAYVLRLTATDDSANVVSDDASLESAAEGGDTLLSLPLQDTLVATSSGGDATPTFTRASDATYTDFSGVVKTVLSGESRFMGSRRVENLLTATEDFSDAEWTTINGGTGTTPIVTPNYALDPDGGMTACRVQLDCGAGGGGADFSLLRQTAPLLASDSYSCASVWIKTTSGGTADILLNWSTGVPITVTDQWTRIADFGRPDSQHADNRTFDVGLRSDMTTETADVLIWHPQLETVVDQATPTPGEYVSKGVLSAPYHGANVDGVKWFTYANGNTVSNNVVTEAQGAAFGDSDYYCDAKGPYGYVSEKSATNIQTYSEDFQNAAWRIWRVLQTVDGEAPTGEITATKMVSDVTAAATHRITRINDNLNTGSDFVQSLYFKEAEHRYVQISLTVISSNASYSVLYDLRDGVVVDTFENNTPIDAFSSAEMVGNGWCRCVAGVNTGTDIRIDTAFELTDQSLTAVQNPSFDGDGVSGVYMWGAMLEEVDTVQYSSTYIKTEASTVTREKDLLAYPVAGNLLADEGSLELEGFSMWSQRITGTANIVMTGFGGLLMGAWETNQFLSNDGSTNFGLTTPNERWNTAPRSALSTWSASQSRRKLAADGDEVTGAFDGDMNVASPIGIGVRASGGTGQWGGTVRNVNIWDSEDPSGPTPPPITTLFDLPLQATLIATESGGDATPSFTRASEATFIDYEGTVKTVPSGAPRFMGARSVWNIAVNTEQFNLWQLGGGGSRTEVLENSIANPINGTMDADLVQAVTASPTGEQYARQAYTLGNINYPTSAESTFTSTVYVKKANWRYVLLRSLYLAVFDFDTETFTYEQAPLSASFEALADGWYRITLNTTWGGTLGYIAVGTSPDGTSATWATAPTNNEGVYVWGWQLEHGSNASEYVSKGTLGAPYHGAGVDGLQFFTTDQAGNPLDALDFYCDAKGPFGYVSESASTNMVRYSETFEDDWFGSRSALSTETVAAPDGSVTSIGITATLVDDAVHRVQLAGQANLVEGTTYTASCYLKKAAKDWAFMSLGAVVAATGNTRAAFFDLAAGVVGSVDPNYTSAIEDMGDGWYRCSVSGLQTSGMTDMLAFGPAAGDNDAAYLDDGVTLEMYAWGYQIEESAHASTYIKTEASTVTRQADALSYPQADNIQDAAGALSAETFVLWPSSDLNSSRYCIAQEGPSRLLAGDNWGTNYITSFDGSTFIRAGGGSADMSGGVVPAGVSWGTGRTTYFNVVNSDTGTFDGSWGTEPIGIGCRGKDRVSQWDGTVRNVKITDTEDTQ